MNIYANDLAFLDISFSDLIFETFSRSSAGPSSPDSLSDDVRYTGDDRTNPSRDPSPPKHRHDGASPLPLGMDWSHPPRKWDGCNMVWPHDPRTGWSYCVTVPSWVIIPKSRGSDQVVFFRVQVGLQSPEGITTTRGVLRRFSDFLKLYSDLNEAFPRKHLPSAPPKKLFRMKSKTLLEERRCSLEEWMEKLLSDIDLSRSAPVATFLELEAAARSYFSDINGQASYDNASASGIAPSLQFQPNSDISLLAASSSLVSEYSVDCHEISELGTPRPAIDNCFEHSGGNQKSDQDYDQRGKMSHRGTCEDFTRRSPGNLSRNEVPVPGESNDIVKNRVTEHALGAMLHHTNEAEHILDPHSHSEAGHIRRLSAESVGSDSCSARVTKISDSEVSHVLSGGSLDFLDGIEASSSVQFPKNLVVAVPANEQIKLNRVMVTMQRRLATAKTDMDDLIARLNQELAVRQYLTTKVNDLEAELESTKQICKENVQQAVLIERERFTKMQWDMEEFREKCLGLDLKLKTELDEKAHRELVKKQVIQENEMLLQELDVAREKVANLQKHSEELELKSKADIKLLVKEVKSLRTSQSNLKSELSRVIKEKIEVERVCQKEKQNRELADRANSKLLHECQILQSRLQECSVNFLVEEEDKLIMDTSSPSDAIDLLITSDNRIGLLLAEAQLLAQEVENACAAAARSVNDGGTRTKDDDLRKMMTDIFIDNATLRKQINSLIRCALNSSVKSDKDEEEDEEVPLQKTVLSKFLER